MRFIAAAILTLAVGFTLGGMGSHWIGGDQTDATGLPLFGWSTTGGDLRPAHFVGLHIMQILPITALTGSRSLVWVTGVYWACLTSATTVTRLLQTPTMYWTGRTSSQMRYTLGYRFYFNNLR